MTLSGHTKEVVDVSFNPDGTRLATASNDGSVRIWDTTPEGATEWFTLTAHNGEIPTFDLTADGKYLATASYDSAAKVWDLASRQLLVAITEHGGPLSRIISPKVAGWRPAGMISPKSGSCLPGAPTTRCAPCPAQPQGGSTDHMAFGPMAMAATVRGWMAKIGT
jgi:WD40 repeat protein